MVLNLGTIHASLGVNIRNSLFPCLILFCSFLLDAWTLLRGFDCVASHEVHHREASLVEESKGFGTRHVLIYQGWVLRLYGAMVGCLCYFMSHSAFVGGSSNASPFGSSQDLKRYLLNLMVHVPWFPASLIVHYCVAIQANTIWLDLHYPSCFNCLSCLFVNIWCHKLVTPRCICRTATSRL